MKSFLLILISTVALTAFTDASFAQAANPQTKLLDTRVRAELATFKGKVYLHAKNLETGEVYSFDGDQRVKTASTIKIIVMIEAFARVAEGRAKWTDELVLTKAARYGGSGVLPELSDGLRLTLRDCVNLMMLVSDNTATNMVLDYLTTDAVNERASSLGLKDTRLMRRVGGGGESKEGKVGDNLKRFGLGATTPHEMVQIMEKLDRGEVINKEASKEMLDLMKREQARYAIGRTTDVPMASKYGALDHLRSCVALVYSKKGRVAIAITVDEMPDVIWSVDNPGYLLMSRLSLLLVDGLSKR